MIERCITQHFFASFLSRDQAYDLMVDVWRCSRPSANLAKLGTRDSAISRDGNGEEDGYISDGSDTSAGSDSGLEYSDEHEISDGIQDESIKDEPGMGNLAKSLPH